VRSQFFTGARAMTQPEIESAQGNPAIQYFLDRDIREMQRLTKGQANYFRKRIRMAVYEGAQLRNVSLAYTLNQGIADRYKIGSAQVYAQVLNPFMWGAGAVKAGLNPEALTGWDTTAGAQAGGQTNNTILNRSLVLGLRITL